MLMIAIFFVLGAVLGLVGLRLMAYWDARPIVKPDLTRLHRRH